MARYWNKGVSCDLYCKLSYDYTSLGNPLEEYDIKNYATNNISLPITIGSIDIESNMRYMFLKTLISKFEIDFFHSNFRALSIYNTSYSFSLFRLLYLIIRDL
jgi:hypothetical protein